MAIMAAGRMPATILENGRAGDWSATLSLSGTPGVTAGVAAVRLTGASAGLFQAELDPSGQVVITPAGALDREAFAPGADPVLSFGLTVLSGGTWLPVEGSWSVTLLGLDDTAPSGLRFSSGGAVLETDIGGVVGSLLAEDPDSPPGNLEYRVLWPDSAEFEIIGNTLRLRDGVDLLRQGGTTREMMIAVSDGLNESAFTLGVSVVNVTNQDGPPVSPPPPPPPAPRPVSEVVVTHTGSSAGVTEGGANDTFTISLSRMPSAPVTVTLTVASDLLLARGNAPGATFGKTVTFVIQPADWAVPHVVTVAASEDTSYEGPETVRVTIAAASADTGFAGKTRRVDVAITDNEGPHGLAIVQTSGTTGVTEGGGGDLFTIALAVRPTASVTLVISGSPDLRVFASGGPPANTHTIVFTTADWSSPRAILVEAINDLLVEGTELSDLTFRLTSADPAYNNLVLPGLPVMVADNDLPPPPPPPPSPPPPSSAILTPGKLAGPGVMSGSGAAVLNRPASDVASLAATADGLLVTWHDRTTLLLDGTRSIAFLDGEISFSGSTPMARAMRAFQTFHGTLPPGEQVAATASMLEQGTPMATIVASLLNSSEWHARAAGLTARQQMELIYAGSIGPIDPVSVDWLLEQVAGGFPMHELIGLLLDIPLAIAHSEREHPTGFWSESLLRREVVRAYDAVLDMTPDAYTVESWSLVLGSGAVSLLQFYTSLAGIDIVKARHAAQSDTDFVVSAYLQAYEREPDATELAWSVNALGQGTASRELVLFALGISQDGALDGPGDAPRSQHGTYATQLPAGQALEPGRSLADTAIDRDGHAVTIRATADLFRIEVAPDGVALRWTDGEASLLGHVESISFADGHLELDPFSRDAVVARLYEAAIGIPIPSDASAIFARNLDDGMAVTTLARLMVSVPQAQARLDHLGLVEQVSLLHQGIFGNLPSGEMLGLLVGALDIDIGTGDILAWLAELPAAAEAFAVRHPTGVWRPDYGAISVIHAYDAILGTMPDPGSLMGWKAVAAQGGLRSLYQNLMATPAHVAQYEGVSNADWVLGHYRAAMEADPTAAELAHYTGLLNAGVPQVDVAMAIGELQPLTDPLRYAAASIDLL